MAVVSVTDNNNRQQNMEGSVSGTSNVGSGPGPQTNTEAFYQGAQVWMRRIGSTGVDHGWTYDHGTTIDMTVSDDRVWMAKPNLLNAPAITGDGLQLRIGSDGSNYNTYWVLDGGARGGDQGEYPAVGGYTIQPIDPSVTAWIDEQTGNPDETAIDHFGVTAQVSATSNAENIGLDAIDIGPGLYMVGGTSTDPRATWQFFIDDDEGSVTAGRFGHVTTVEGVVFAYGKFIIGETNGAVDTATEWTDSLRTVVFPGGRVAEGWNELVFELGASGTVITEANMSYIGRGRKNTKIYFDSSANQIDATNDEIDITSHPFLTGHAVLYSKEGNTGTTGLTDATEYFVRSVSADAISLHTTRDNAFTNTSPVNLSATTAGENHSLRLQPDTRPFLTIRGSTGSASFTGNVYTAFSCIQGSSTSTFSFCAFTECKLIVLSNGTFTDCTFDNPTTPIGEAFMQAIHANDLDELDNSTFSSSGIGHAIEITTDGTVAEDIASLSNVAFTNYFDTDGDNTGGWGFNASTDVDGGTETITITGHSFVDGDPVYYSDEGGTAITGLTDQSLYYLNSTGANTVTVHLTADEAIAGTNAVDITAGSSETHKFYSANAAIYNNTGTALTINITNGGSTPTVRNSAGSSVVVNNAVTLTINGVTEGAQCFIGAGVGGPNAEGTVLMNKPANSSGVATESYNFSTDQPVRVRVRSSGICSAAIADDGGSLTDETEDARDRTGTNDVTLFPASPVVNTDQYYFGGLTTFTKMKVLVSTAGSGTYVITWEYWNGSSWATLTTSSADDFKSTGNNLIQFTAPGDWATTSVNSQGPYYYIRMRWTSGTMTTSPLAENISMNVTKYLSFSQDNTISGDLTITPTWVEDNIAT